MLTGGLLLFLGGTGCSRDLARDAVLDHKRVFRPLEVEHIVDRWEMALPQGWIITDQKQNTLLDGWTGPPVSLSVTAEPAEGGARVVLWVTPLSERLTRMEGVDVTESARYLGRSYTYHYFMRQFNPEAWPAAPGTAAQVFGIGY